MYKRQGNLSPTAGNSYDYIPTTYTDPAYAPIYAKIINKNPLVPETS